MGENYQIANMKHNEEKQKLKAMKAIFENSHNKSWECIECGCNKSAINSHLLQRHGILSNIVENGHLAEVKGNRYDEVG